MNKIQETSGSADTLPRAQVKRDRIAWLFWLVPVAAAVLCVWFGYHDFISAGPKIKIYFQDTEGLQVENTPLMYRGVNIGEVKAIKLAADGQQVEVQAELLSSAKDFARAGSIYWIVHPDVKVGAISGLKTLVSGEYIGVRPGSGAMTNRFVGEQNEPNAEQPGALAIMLTAPRLGSLQELSPIFYRGIQVGEVLYYQLGKDAREVLFHARIWKDYAPLVHADSKFWNAGGISFRFGIFKGMQISAESPKTVITGGLEFATPPEGSTVASNNTVFVVNDKPEDKWRTWAPEIKLQLPAKATQTNLQTNDLPVLNP